MLGTNDLLQEREATAPDMALRMKHFLETIVNTAASWETSPKLLLLAPPQMQRGAWVNEEKTLRESQKLGEEYRKVAETLCILFVDTGKWEIPLTFDGVHLSEEGHRKFAQELIAYKNEIDRKGSIV
jgi:lysophospholipase L1-like esterase